jgi:glycosyltransferase involved in cell wall biosynthesis
MRADKMTLRSIGVAIPCLNEEKTIAKVIRDFRQAAPSAKIYVFDNGSTDSSAKIAANEGATVVTVPIRGKGAVVNRMFEVIDEDICVMVDGDDTYPASELGRLLEEFDKANADMLIATRLGDFQKAAFRRFHLFGNHVISGLVSVLFSVRVTDILSGYRIMSKRFFKTVPLRSIGFQIETELTLQALAKRFVIYQTPVPYRARIDGSESKLNSFSDGALIFTAIFLILKDYRPLAFFTGLSAVLAASSIAIGYTPVYDYILHRYVFHVPLAILAASVGIISVISMFCGLILDTLSKYHSDNFEVWKKSIKR